VVSALKLIRQSARGLYDYPQKDDQLGELLPWTDDIARALPGYDAIQSRTGHHDRMIRQPLKTSYKPVTSIMK